MQWPSVLRERVVLLQGTTYSDSFETVGCILCYTEDKSCTFRPKLAHLSEYTLS